MVFVAHTAAGILFPRIRFARHDALFDFHNQTNVRVDPQSGNHGLDNDQTNRIAVRDGVTFHIVGGVDIGNPGPNVEAVVDEIPDHGGDEHGDIVQASTQQGDNGHDQANGSCDNADGRVGVDNVFDLIIVDVVEAGRDGRGDVQDERNGRPNDEQNGNDNDGTAAARWTGRAAAPIARSVMWMGRFDTRMFRWKSFRPIALMRWQRRECPG